MPEVDPNLAEIKQREQNARDAIRRGEREVDCGVFSIQQLGLDYALCDAFGRVWRRAGDGKIVMVYPQRSQFVACADLAAGDMSDVRPGHVMWLDRSTSPAGIMPSLPDDSEIVRHAKAELDRINFGEGDTAVMVDILRRFFAQWNSGGGVWVASNVLARCIAQQPLSPLTGADDEWHDPMGNGELLQNVRCGSVFKCKRDADGNVVPALVSEMVAHDIDAPDPYAPISFPYDPATREVRAPVVEVEVPDGRSVA